MSMEPIQRLMSNNLVGALNTPQLLNDQVTGLTFIQLNVPNTILDMYNSPDPAGGVSSASSNYSAGAAQRAGYSTGSPR